MTLSTRRARAFVVAALLVTVPACTVWRPYTPEPTSSELPERVRFHLVNGDWLTMEPVALEGDSVWIGVVGNRSDARVPLREVRKVEVARSTNGPAAALAIGGGLAFLLVIAAAASMNDARFGG